MNGIVLVRKDELNEYRVGDYVIYYSRISQAAIRQVRAMASAGSSKGRVDDNKFRAEVYRRCLKGWAGIVLDPGKPGNPDVTPPVPATPRVMFPDVDPRVGPTAEELEEFTSLFPPDLSMKLNTLFAANGMEEDDAEGPLGN